MGGLNHLNTMRTRIAIAGAVTGMTVLLAACGGASPTAEPSGTTAPTAANGTSSTTTAPKVTTPEAKRVPHAHHAAALPSTGRARKSPPTTRGTTVPATTRPKTTTPSTSRRDTSSPPTTTPAKTETTTTTTTMPTPSGPPTVEAATVTGEGTVLVNTDGRTLYLLTSEKGGRILCTASGGCTLLWPVEELASGLTTPLAGPGVSQRLLGTERRPDGTVQVTYDGWPLYTYAGDSAAGQANGEGIPQLGGIWEALSPTGVPIPKK